jgi:hypothetical protein
MRGVPARAVVLTAVAVVAVAQAGCGAQDGTRANRDRPAAPIIVTALVSKDAVSVSPARFGAGPIELIVTNHTDRSQQVTLETSREPGSPRSGVRQRTGPINPRDTAMLRADVRPGDYLVRISRGDIRSGRLSVGAPRPSAQQDLMLP